MQVSPFISRFLALGLLVGCLFLFFHLVAEPMVAEYGANRDAIEQSQRLEARYLAIAASRPQLEQRLHDMEAGLKVSELSYPSSSDALTGAKIQSIVSELVNAVGGRLNSTQILVAAEESGFRRIAIRVQLVADIVALQAILHKLEGAKPYLFIDNVVLRATPAARRQHARRRSKRPEVIKQSMGRLNIRFDVLGFAKPGNA